MKIADILEIADKRTKGTWSASRTATSPRREVFNTWPRVDCHNEAGELYDVCKLVYQDDDDNARFIAIAPKMEDKLREIVELMPQIEEYVEFSYGKSGNAGMQNGILGLRNKLTKWMEE